MSKRKTQRKALPNRRRLALKCRPSYKRSKSALVKGMETKAKIRRLKEGIEQVQAENVQLKVEINRLKSAIDQAEGEKFSLAQRHREETRALQLELEELKPPKKSSSKKKKANNVSPTLQLELDWISGPNMPVNMSGYIQSVEIDGMVYVGGGLTDEMKDEFIVYVYNAHNGKWHHLPPYSASLFGMTTFKNKLILVGGIHSDDSASNKLGEWQSYSKKWSQPFPPMFSARVEPSTISYRHWLVVAGGYTPCYVQGKFMENHILNTIEVLDADANQWSFGPRTPIRWHGMKSTVVGNTWYLMGGCTTGEHYEVFDVYGVCLDNIISHTSSKQNDVDVDVDSEMWITLPEVDSHLCSLLSFRGSLFAVGSFDFFDIKAEFIFYILRYIPESKTWMQVGELPCVELESTSVMIMDKIVVISENGLFTSLVK